MILDKYQTADGREMVVCVPDPLHKLQVKLKYSTMAKMTGLKFQLKERYPERSYVSYSDVVEYLVWLATESIEEPNCSDTGQQLNSETCLGDVTSN